MASALPKNDNDKTLAAKPSTSASASQSTSLAEEPGVELNGSTANQKTGADAPAEVAGKEGEGDADAAQPQKYGWRFYAIYSSLIAATVLSALDGSIVSTALPTIAETLDLGSNAVWVANVYFLTGLVASLSSGQKKTERN